MAPAAALAHELEARGVTVILFTDNRGLRYKNMFSSTTEIHVLRAGTLGAGLMGKIKGMTNLGLGILQAQKLLVKLRPSAVVGFGGYPCVPGVFAAQSLKIPTILHEQNAIIGKANIWLARKARHIALSIDNQTGLDDAQKKRVTVTGNPVRGEITALAAEDYPAIEQDGELRILVVGGSLGASVFSDVVPDTLAGLSDAYKKRLNVTQQCREEDLKDVKKAYKKAGIAAETASFFENMPEILAGVHLVIGRSGASTVAELSAAGRPAIFVPYPHHKDQQQKMNADAMADHGGAWVMNEQGFTRDALQAKIEGFLQHPEILVKAAEKARECGSPDAAKNLADLAADLV